MQQTTQYWFPAKHYGWGWGLPLTWQGWLTLAIFLGFVIGGLWYFPPKRAPVTCAFYLAAVSILLVTMCWLKGEPPRWRWGNSGYELG